MTAKLDPALEAMVADPDPGDMDREVTVIIALDTLAGQSHTEELETCGVATRSILGDIVTGKVSVGNLRRLENIPWVVKVESSSPLGPG